MREVVSLNVGQCGCQVGNTMWEFLTQESGLDRTGVKTNEESNVNTSLFHEHLGRFTPRTCFIDSEPTSMDEILIRSKIKSTYIEEFWVKGREDCQGNFAIGKLFASKQLLPSFIKSFRRLLEACDSISILKAYHATSGGTGSGLLVTMLTILDDILPKTQKHLHSVIPSENETPTTAAYNTIFSWAQTEDFHTLRFVYDNHSMYDILDPVLSPIGQDISFRDINTLPSLVSCNLLLSYAKGALGSMSLPALSTNLVPYPHLKMLSSAVVPLLSRGSTVKYNALNLTADAFSQNKEMCTLDTKRGTYLTVGLLFRGSFSVGPVDNAARTVTEAFGIPFQPWIPSPIKKGIANWQQPEMFRDYLEPVDKLIVKISNHSEMSELIQTSLAKVENMLSQHRPYVYWYTQMGMEEGEFNESVEKVQTIVDDHRSACTGALVDQD